MKPLLPRSAETHSASVVSHNGSELDAVRHHALPGASDQPDAGGDAPELSRYLGVLRKHWPLILSVTSLIVIAVAVGTFLQTPIYRASGLIEFRGQTADGVAVDALFQNQRLSGQFLETQYGVLRSPALARRAMEAVAGIEDSARRAAVAVDSMLDTTLASAVGEDTARVPKAVSSFAKRLIVSPVSGSNLVWLHYESPDPVHAARAVNAVIESYASMRAEGAQVAVVRLRAEVDSVRSRLTDAERQLQAYARANGLTLGGRGTGTGEDLPHERLRLLQQQLAEAEADRYNKESLYGLVPAQGADLLESEILQALSVRLATLRSEYAKLRATFLEDYPRTREVKGQIDEVETLLAREQGRLRGAITSRYTAAVRRQALLQRAIDQQRALIDQQGEKSTQYRIRARDVEAQQELYAKLQERLRAAEVSAAVATTDVAVVEAAIAPLTPVRPIVSSNLQLALIVGLVLGVGLAFLREYVDVTIRGVDELVALPVPLLGLIPAMPLVAERRIGGSAARFGAMQSLTPRLQGGGRAPFSVPSARVEPDSDALARIALEDAFGTLRTSVLFADSERHAARSLLVTSAQPGDGKTTVAVNLALSIARLEGRVLLVDGDTRRPAVHEAFGIPLGEGLTEALRGYADWMALVREQVVPGLDVLTAGQSLRSPTELLSSEAMKLLVDEAHRAYDFVVFDSPALFINAADTRILAPLMDGVVLVVRSGITPRALARALLRQVPNVFGVVLNAVDAREFPSYYYAYGDHTQHAVSS